MPYASPSTCASLSGYLLPEKTHEQLLELRDELQLLVAFAATGEALDEESLPMELKRTALAGYLRRASERIETALQQCSYSACFSGAGTEAS